MFERNQIDELRVNNINAPLKNHSLKKALKLNIQFIREKLPLWRYQNTLMY